MNPARSEQLINQLYGVNKRLMRLEGQLLRWAVACGIQREDFLERYYGQELNPRWQSNLGKLEDKKWDKFLERHKDDIKRARSEIQTISDQVGLPIKEYRRIVQMVQRRARGQPREEGNGRGQPASCDFHCQKIHQSRPAIPGFDSGGEYRPDESGG